MSSKSLKYERILDDSDLQHLLKTLNSVMEIDKESLMTAEGFKKIKLSVSKDFGQSVAKLKISLPRTKTRKDGDEDCITPGEELIKYSKLKKRMKKSFKVIKANLEQDQLPPEEAVASFLSDSDMMVCYPGYGDESYLDYIKICKWFTKGWADKDIPALQEAAKALDESKSQCHEKYK